MNIFRLKSPERIFVTYDGSIFDTAAIIGLYHQRTNIDQILFTGVNCLESMKVISQLNTWLRKRNWPIISLNESSSESQLIELKSTNPLREWNWEREECICVLRLAGFEI